MTFIYFQKLTGTANFPIDDMSSLQSIKSVISYIKSISYGYKKEGMM